MSFKKILSICTLSAVLILSGISTVRADSIADGLKKCLLVFQDGQSSIYSYNTNNDNVVNVLDFCRVKRNLLMEPQATAPVETTVPVTEVSTEYNKTGSVNFDFQNAQIISEGSQIRIPVIIKNNSIGIISVQMNVNYDHNYFVIDKVEPGEFGANWSVSDNRYTIQFNSENGADITASQGTIGYVVLSVASYTPAASYCFSGSNLQAVTSLDGNNFRTLTVNECPDIINSQYLYYSKSQTTVTTQKITTPPVTTAPAVKVTTTPPVQLNVEKSDIELEAVELINQWRKELNLEPMKLDDVLFYCTDIRVKDLLQRFDQVRPDGSDVMDLLRTNGAAGWYMYSQYYNRGINSAAGLLSQYKASAKINPGMLADTPYYSRIGVGYNDGYWVVILTR